MVIEQERTKCREECGAVVTERNRYFTGKCMTARDFRADPDYLLSHHRLHNRLLHGWGIVCGLRVTRHKNKDCPNWVVVRSGIALDCCGRELVLACDTPYELALPDAGEPVRLVLCLRYCEEQVEHLPVLFHEGECSPDRREANRVREVVRLELRELSELDPDCWRERETGMDAPCRDDCDDGAPCRDVGCVEPWCPCGSCVPLAVIEYDPAHPERPFEIDQDGRRQLPLPSDYVTRIVGINWPHGGELTLQELEDGGGRLEVRFDRRILPAEGEASGISEFTFVVQYGGIQQDLEFLPFERDTPPSLDEDDDCLAVFTIDPAYLDRRRHRENIAGSSVYVALKCDFIVDCHGNAVSGKHLGGRLASGDGLPGGIFESWFRVSTGPGGEE